MTFLRALLRVRLWYFSPGLMSLHATLSFFSLVGFVRFGFVRCASVLRMNLYF